MNSKFKLLLLSSLIFAGSVHADYAQFKDTMTQEEYEAGSFLGGSRDSLIKQFIMLHDYAINLYKQYPLLQYPNGHNWAPIILSDIIEGELAQFRRNIGISDFHNYDEEYLTEGKRKTEISDCTYDFINDHILQSKNPIKWFRFFNALKSVNPTESDISSLIHWINSSAQRFIDLSKLLNEASSNEF